MQATRLVADIGGTNARFALLDANNQVLEPVTVLCKKFDDLASAIAHFLELRSIEKLHAASIAVATPALKDHVQFTNNDWSFSKSQLKATLGVDALHVVNDFTALALSIPHLPAEQLNQVGEGQVKPFEPIGLIGPGTGLGVSGLIHTGTHWVALKSEGGHVAASAFTEREKAVLGALAPLLHPSPVSAERILAGQGLSHIYAALRQLDGIEQIKLVPPGAGEKESFEVKTLEPHEITANGLNGSDPHCVEAIDIFCALLGSCAGDLALTLGASGGIYIGGGVVPRLGETFAASQFRARFENKGRMRHFLEGIPTQVILAPYPGLIGAAQLLS